MVSGTVAAAEAAEAFALALVMVSEATGMESCGLADRE
jgi:hypothetical protein